MTDQQTMTRAGWPRPVHQGWPVPWVSPQENLGIMDVPRLDACASGVICAVCGRDHVHGARAWALVAVPLAEVEEAAAAEGPLDVQAMDNATLHDECLRLSLAMCPKLRELVERGELTVAEVTAGTATVERSEDGMLQGTTRVHSTHDAASGVPR